MIFLIKLTTQNLFCHILSEFYPETNDGQEWQLTDNHLKKKKQLPILTFC